MPLELFTVIVARPAASAVSSPEAFTLQTVAFEVLYLTFSVVSKGFSVGTKRKDSPMVRVFFDVFNVKELAGTVRTFIVCTVLFPR